MVLNGTYRWGQRDEGVWSATRGLVVGLNAVLSVFDRVE